MKLYLDSKDLIAIFQNQNPCTGSHLSRLLREGDHKLAVSYYTIQELAAPLLHSLAKTNVMKLLDELSQLPLTYVHADIRGLELAEALRAFLSKDEYKGISPYVDRFDKALHLKADPATRHFLHYSLAEIVWELHAHGELKGLEAYAPMMRKLIASDRAMKNKPSLKANFVKVIERQLVHDGLSCPKESVPNFAYWVNATPARCPSIQLCHEVWHQIVKNNTDRLVESDMEDYQHVICLPYVDLMTLDKRMRAYVSQAARRLRKEWDFKIMKSTTELLGRIESMH
jgi:hypothetical protein